MSQVSIPTRSKHVCVSVCVCGYVCLRVLTQQVPLVLLDALGQVQGDVPQPDGLGEVILDSGAAISDTCAGETLHKWQNQRIRPGLRPRNRTGQYRCCFRGSARVCRNQNQNLSFSSEAKGSEPAHHLSQGPVDLLDPPNLVLTSV